MKNKIILLIIFISLIFSCKQFFKKFFIKSYNSKAIIKLNTNTDNKNILAKLVDVLNYRFNKYAIYAKYDLTEISNGKIQINVSNFKNIKELESLFTNQGKFEILSKTNKNIFNNEDDIFVKEVTVEKNKFDKLTLNFNLKDKYINIFAEFTESNIGEETIFKLDNVILAKPVITEKIKYGRAQLSMPHSTVDELLLFEVLLLSGQLPVKLNKSDIEIIETQASIDK